ncbi:MAG: GIY-YIG nuclease superfamily protein [Candidatus Scalindua rubra]|jgi:putative endonuclease|uniref:GIY-YIG nuclease superfamily protein n=1 Tax=Candidatus Scalindua rubra TaxID=1872076 RepID=A0A1E3X9W8_9BACT|nr:MAG: GIY-YIG nuclease superfamily protein [Candidatus Scalindua rubra]
MHYVYIIKSIKTKKIYIGYTSDLKRRLKEHNEGENYTTMRMLPIELVYYEAYKSKEDAKNREKQLKRYGNALLFLKKRIKNCLL